MSPTWVRPFRTDRWPAPKSEEERGRSVRFEGRGSVELGRREGSKRNSGAEGVVVMIEKRVGGERDGVKKFIIMGVRGVR